VDIALGIDPFLLFKSRDPKLAGFHRKVLDTFNLGLAALRKADRDEARRIFSFPEVPEIGLGYAERSKKGSGVGEFVTELILETMQDSPDLLKRGVRHIEEMQLVSVGIGPDRISDIAANILKLDLIEYTQQQCATWGIQLHSGVPIPHIWNLATGQWDDAYHDLPVSPVDGTPILFVPRRIVRALPWINFQDFLRLEFTAYLRAKRVRGRLTRTQKASREQGESAKQEAVRITRVEVERIDRYVDAKEGDAAAASPSMQEYVRGLPVCAETERLKAALDATPTGAEHAASFQRLVLEMLNLLFNPDLIDGQLEVRTHCETERRDIIVLNDSDKTFWTYVRMEHSALMIMFETKNTDRVRADDLNQMATYLGDRIGRLAFVVTRQPATDAQVRKCFSIYNDSQPRKVILWLSDRDLAKMLDMACAGQDAMIEVRAKYRTFRQTVQ
jgi:hypothetical protein